MNSKYLKHENIYIYIYPERKYKTKLAIYYGNFREKHKKRQNIKWSILQNLKTGIIIENTCKLYQEEKIVIATYKESRILLNGRLAIIAKWRNVKKFNLKLIQSG